MSEKAEGLEEYTPTRLEWLAVVLNGMMPIFTPRGLDSFFIDGDDDGKTLTFVVIYKDDIPKKFLDSYIDRAKGLFQLISEKHGWDSWVELEIDTNVMESEGKQEENEDS